MYDLLVISDKQMAEWGRQAFVEAVQANRIQPNNFWEGYAPNGLKFGGYIDNSTKAVRTFYPLF